MRIADFSFEDEGTEIAERLAPELPPVPDETVVSRFARWARTRANEPAVVDEWNSLTYAELDAWSNRIARRLLALAVGSHEVHGAPARGIVAVEGERPVPDAALQLARPAREQHDGVGSKAGQGHLREHDAPDTPVRAGVIHAQLPAEGAGAGVSDLGGRAAIDQKTAGLIFFLDGTDREHLEFANEQQEKRLAEIEARRAQSRLDEMALVRHLRKHALRAG